MTIRRAERLPRVRAGAWAVRGGCDHVQAHGGDPRPVRAPSLAMRIVPPCISTDAPREGQADAETASAAVRLALRLEEKARTPSPRSRRPCPRRRRRL